MRGGYISPIARDGLGIARDDLGITHDALNHHSLSHATLAGLEGKRCDASEERRDKTLLKRSGNNHRTIPDSNNSNP